jgi:dipeptidase
MLAQIEAITRATTPEEEEVTKDIIESVAQDRLRFMQRFLNALRKNQPEELKKYEDIAPIDLEFAVSEATATLRHRYTETSTTPSAETSPSTIEGQEEKTDISSEIKQQSQSSRPSKKKPDITKLVLVKTFLKGEIDGITGYESHIPQKG